MVKAEPSASVKPPVLVKAPRVLMALPAWPKLADPALPVRLPTCRLPPGWVIAPVADVVSAPVVTVPASDKGPVTVNATDGRVRHRAVDRQRLPIGQAEAAGAAGATEGGDGVAGASQRRRAG